MNPANDVVTMSKNDFEAVFSRSQKVQIEPYNTHVTTIKPLNLNHNYLRYLRPEALSDMNFMKKIRVPKLHSSEVLSIIQKFIAGQKVSFFDLPNSLNAMGGIYDVQFD